MPPPAAWVTNSWLDIFGVAAAIGVTGKLTSGAASTNVAAMNRAVFFMRVL